MYKVAVLGAKLSREQPAARAHENVHPQAWGEHFFAKLKKMKPKSSRVRQCFTIFWQTTLSFEPLRMAMAKNDTRFEKNA